MNDVRTCEQCSAVLDPSAPEGLCPRCVLATVGNIPLDESTSERRPSPERPPRGIQHPPTQIRHFGDYELLEEIARGGMGVVYKARQRSLNRIVAVKMILTGQSADKEFVRRFRTEASATAILQHPNIVAVHDVGVQDGQHFFSMDFVEGQNLSQLVGQRPLAAAGATRYLKLIAEAIHYAHERGILHRDLKPSNVLIDASDQPRITDFGLAKWLESESSLTMAGQVLGTPHFVPPEQAGAAHVKVGPPSDVYALGGILYYLLTARAPFQGETLEATLHQVLNTEPISPRLLNPAVSRDLETICLKCLEKEPARRYRSARDFAEELGRFLRDEPIWARPIGPASRFWRWCRRKPAVAAAAGATLIAVAAAAVFAHQARYLEQRRLAEKRGAALERALLAARSGNLDEAEESIRAAELAGATPGELRQLRGQLALYRGDYREAIQHLEQAALLSPQSVALAASLSFAYTQFGQWDKSARMLDKMNTLPPKTPEDYLFKGMVESEMDPALGLATLEKAVRLRPSGIALMVRAEARLKHADDFRDPSQAERATAELDLLQEILPGNPVVISRTLLAQLAAASAYEQAGQTSRREAALAQAAAAASVLKQYPVSQDALFGRLMYLKYVGNHATAFDLLHQTDLQLAFLNHSYVVALYERGEFAEALAVMERGAWSDHWRCYILAELPNGPERALDEFRRMWNARRSLTMQTALRLLGRKAEAVEMSRSLRQRFGPPRAWRNGWDEKLLDYNCDVISDADLLKAAGKSKWNQCEAHFYIGVTQLSDGQREVAREHFRQAIATRIVYFFEYNWSWAFLSRLEQDPQWPPWIPVKQGGNDARQNIPGEP